MWTKFILALGSFLEWSFQLFPFLNNWFNFFMMAVGFVFMVWWIKQMFKHQEEEKNHQY
ncbi:MAG: hypothetical protein M0D57_02300 [Sphingobacteriales bacterium JAD_PAG50586_3]|nr:MAG: hypothetical protein M0D57_02300 [Sphingobacteriales bacterium JAD_PAG50586_3]